MPKKATITKNEIIRAGSVHNAVSKAAEALLALDPASVGASVSESATISMAAKILGKIAGEAKAILDQAEELFKNRDVALINRASARFFSVDKDVEECKAHQYHAQEAFNEKVAELKRQGFSQAEIDNMIESPAPQIEALEQKIVALLAEKAKVMKFMSDIPIYNPSLLAGTAVEVAPAEQAEAA